MDKNKVHRLEEEQPQCQCPCCDYITLPDRGHWELCPVCYWEDDGQDTDNLDEPSAPNHGLTLREGRGNFIRFGACEEEMRQFVLSDNERQGYIHRPREI